MLVYLPIHFLPLCEEADNLVVARWKKKFIEVKWGTVEFFF